MHARDTIVYSLIYCLVVLTCLASANSQDVTTWHYDNLRTGWQQHENLLNTSSVNNTGSFGPLFQYPVAGEVYAQPLALTAVSGVTNCTGPCNVLFIATEQDMLYAFRADSPYDLLWSQDLAARAGGIYHTCPSGLMPPPPCEVGVLDSHIGVTGTPVIDNANGNSILFVVSLVEFTDGSLKYYLHAINYKTGAEMSGSPIQVTGMVNGGVPLQWCGTSQQRGGNITFDAPNHLQRAGLLFLPPPSVDADSVYIAFTPADIHESSNGWLFRYQYSNGSFSQTVKIFSTTGYGTGGGIWMDGAAPASDGTYIYLSTANGTFDASGITPPPPIPDYGDSLLKMNSDLTVADYYTPSDVFTYPGLPYNGRCFNDVDFGSGGVMLLPHLVSNYANPVMITTDKESNFYLVDRTNLGKFHGTDQIVEPPLKAPPDANQYEGYWGTPVYWEWTAGVNTKAVYASPDATSEAKNHNVTEPPDSIYMYELNTQGPPISNPWNYRTQHKFCVHGGAPSISSATTSAYLGTVATGVLWAYEDTDTDNPTDCNADVGPAVLRAYDASNMIELYSSSALSRYGGPSVFSTPVVFNGKVYIGTRGTTNGQGITTGIVDVFGPCTPTCTP